MGLKKGDRAKGDRISTSPPYILFGVMAGLYVLVRHRANSQGILAGTEPTISQ